MMRRSVSVFIALLMAELSPAVARADILRLAVVPLQHRAPVTGADSERVREGVLRAFSGPWSLMELPEVDRRLAISDLECTTARCLAETAALLEVDMLVGGRLARTNRGAGPPVWTLDLWLFDARSKTTAATARDQRPGAVEQVSGLAVKLGRELIRRARGGDGRIVVRSIPPGASVEIDGAPVGITNMTFGVTAGRHTVTLKQDGYASRVHEVVARSGKPVTLTSTLVLTDARPGGRSLPVGVLKWASLGVAAVGLAAGITLLALDGQGTCSDELPRYACPELRDTLASGIALTAIGGAAAAGSGLLFYLDRGRGERAVSAAVVPAGSPGGFAVTGILRY